ncbi:DUF58 domain-containing protein [Allobranchiibius sp. GilTou38]|uniref:DUF58 domain-containing protein n=1 Tax=Allobranchiibius sp. GilTou38 TaxID=2815210 RepID=UPI001AA0D340|nr:DUF58 domain-containing protein [Allobranchiibius sp. GilTou38]MBO1766956.1 DUF58 domain-containing protein [Allobranchiibius sp. GilTou38]
MVRAPAAGRRHTRARLTSRGHAVVAAGVALTITGLALGYGDITRIGIFLLLLPLLATLLASRRAAHLELTRTIAPVILHPDEPAPVRAVFANRAKRASRFGTAQDSIDASLGDRPRYTLPSIPARGKAVVEYTVRGRARGLHTIGPTTIEHPDPFGMCWAGTVIPADDQILVLPQTFPLVRHRLPYASGGEGDSGHSIALHGEQDVSIRAYVEGDELRRIHWAATAHRGELMVRHEDRPAYKHALLMYDARTSAHRVDGAYDSFEWTISATASIALLLHDLNYLTHLLAPESLDDERYETPSSSDTMLRDLAEAQECEDGLHAQVLAQASRTASGSTTMVAVLTDRPAAGLRQLAACCGRGAVGIAIVVDTDAYRRDSEVEGADARAVAHEFQAAGWRTVVVGPRSGVPAAWRSVAGIAPVGAAMR